MLEFVRWVIALMACACGRSAFEELPDGPPRIYSSDSNDRSEDDGNDDDSTGTIDAFFEDDRSYTTFSPCPTELAFVEAAGCSAGRLQVNPDSVAVRGAAWLAVPYPTNVNLSIKVRMQITTAALPGDGAAIVLHNDPRGTTAIGGTGGELGAGAITPSVALELDTFVNANEPSTTEHIGLDLDGIVLPGAMAAASPFPLSDGTAFTVWLDYNKTAKVVSAYIARTQTKPATPVVTLATDLAHLGSRMFIGFTGATGADHESNHVLSLTIDVSP